MRLQWKSSFKPNSQILLILLLISGCSVVGGHQPPPTPPVPIETLLLEPDLFPGWQVGEKDTSDSSCSVLGCGDELERIHESFIYKSPQTSFAHPQVFDNDMDVLATHSIWRYRSVEQADKEYAQHADDYAPEISYALPSEITTPSTVAQQRTTICQPAKQRSFCATTAQYGHYVVSFTGYIDPPVMSYVHYAEILAAIDKKMASVADVP